MAKQRENKSLMKIDIKAFFKPINSIKIIHVQLNMPYQGENHYFFGSLAAIYDVLPPDVVGASLNTLYKNSKFRIFITKRATITVSVLYRKKTNRKRKGAV